MWLWKFLVQVQVFTFLWKIKDNGNTEISFCKLNFLTSILNFLQFERYGSIFSSRAPKKLWLFIKFIKFERFMSKSLEKYSHSRQQIIKEDPLRIKSVFLKKSWKKSIAVSFLKINMWIPNPTLQVHQSFIVLYYYNSQSNVGVFNLKKLLSVWSSALVFVQNLIVYNLHYVLFSTSYFKYESLAVNWENNKQLKTLWRYSHPFLFLLNNNMTQKSDLYFRYLQRRIVKIALVVDVYYHKRTIYYLNKYKFITIGPVPLSSSFYTLNVAFPSSSNSIFSNLFFIRLLFHLKKTLAASTFKSLCTVS